MLAANKPLWFKLEMAIYGIHGKKQHGKDTFANLLVSANPRWRVFHFADELKHVLARVFGQTAQQLWGDEKERPYYFPHYIDESLEALQRETGLVIVKRGMVARTPRELMQYVGTEYVRAAKETFWIDRLRERALAAFGEGYSVAVPDVRFDNEAQLIRDIGGVLIRVVRPQAEPATDPHATEQADFPVDLELHFAEGRTDLMAAVARGMA